MLFYVPAEGPSPSQRWMLLNTVSIRGYLVEPYNKGWDMFCITQKQSNLLPVAARKHGYLTFIQITWGTHLLCAMPMVRLRYRWNSICCKVMFVLGSNHRFSSVDSHSFIAVSNASSFSKGVRHATCIVKFSKVFYRNGIGNGGSQSGVLEGLTPLRRTLVLRGRVRWLDHEYVPKLRWTYINLLNNWLLK